MTLYKNHSEIFGSSVNIPFRAMAFLKGVYGGNKTLVKTVFAMAS